MRQFPKLDNKLSIGLFCLIPLILMLILLYTLRIYQSYHLKSLFRLYDNAELVKLHPLKSVKNRKLITYTFPEMKLKNIKQTTINTAQHFQPAGFKYEYLVIETNIQKCPDATFFAKYLYQPICNDAKQCAFIEKYWASPMSHSFIISIKPKQKIFFPVFSLTNTYFYGIQIPVFLKECVTGFYKVKDLSKTPLLMPVELSENWQGKRLYQKIETAPEKVVIPTTETIAALPTVIKTFPKDLALPNNTWKKPFLATETKLLSPIIHHKKDKLIVDGSPKGGSTYLASFQSKNITNADIKQKDYYFIAQGLLLRGGIGVGLVKDNHWQPKINIVGYQPFKIAIKVIKPGLYTPILSNELIGLPENHVVVEKIGWYIIKKNKR